MTEPTPGANCEDDVDHHGQTDRRGDGGSGGALTQFAFRVVSELRRNTQIETGVPQDDVLSLLLRHALNGNTEPLGSLYNEMKRRGIAAEEIIDTYFPAAITRIGNEWHEGDLDILQATLRMSRLQALLRELGRAWVSDSVGGPVSPRVLAGLARRVLAAHRWGRLIAANQMRRSGVSVCVCLVPNPVHLLEQKYSLNNRFDAVFVSASNRFLAFASLRLVCEGNSWVSLGDSTGVLGWRAYLKDIAGKTMGISRLWPTWFGADLGVRSVCDLGTLRMLV